MKIIDNKKDKLTVIVSAVFVCLYIFGTVFAGALLKDNTTSSMSTPAPTVLPVSPSTEAPTVTEPAQQATQSTVTTQDTPKSVQKVQNNNDNDDD